MKTKIYKSKYKNMNSIIMESSYLIITIISQSGSKIQSIYNKVLDKEYLFQSTEKEFKIGAYGISFEKSDLSGFDEAFPTIEECFYPLEPWKGIKVPDHGELWALPWDYSINKDSIILKVNGVRFPYSVEKKVEFLRDNSFRITYNLKNLSNFDFYFIWAPHTLFNCEEKTIIILPPSVEKIISTCNIKNKLGNYGTIHSWPVTMIDGKKYDISKIYPKYPDKCEKYFAMGKIKEGWCALYNTKSGDTIGLSYPVSKVPYLGVWEGIMNGVYVTAMEPCTADLDALSTAVLWKRSSVVRAKSGYEWFLNMTFDTVKKINSIDQDGVIS